MHSDANSEIVMSQSGLNGCSLKRVSTSWRRMAARVVEPSGVEVRAAEQAAEPRHAGMGLARLFQRGRHRGQRPHVPEHLSSRGAVDGKRVALAAAHDERFFRELAGPREVALDVREHGEDARFAEAEVLVEVGDVLEH